MFPFLKILFGVHGRRRPHYVLVQPGIYSSLAWSLLALMLLPAASWAHGIKAACRIQGNQVEVSAMFDKNIPAPNAKVIVLDENEKALVEGKTDEEGRWSFALPPPGNYQVKVNAGAGHRKTVTLKVGGTDDAETDSASPITDQETWTDSLWLRAALGVLVIVLLGLGLKWLLPKRGKELRSEVR